MSCESRERKHRKTYAQDRRRIIQWNLVVRSPLLINRDSVEGFYPSPIIKNMEVLEN